MHPRTKSAALWGLVGAFVFLVAHQTYLLAGGEFTSVSVLGAMTVIVGLVAAGSAYAFEARLLQYGR